MDEINESIEFLLLVICLSCASLNEDQCKRGLGDYRHRDGAKSNVCH